MRFDTSPISAPKRAGLFAFVTLGLSLLLCTALEAAPAATQAATPTLPAAFADIKGHWAEREINQWSQAGLVMGFPDGSFRPDSPVTEEQFFAMLLRLLPPYPGHEPDDFAEETYLSRAKGRWSNDVYRKLWAAGITTFGDPAAGVTRLDAARTLLRALAGEHHGYTYRNTADQRFRDVPLYLHDAPNRSPRFNDYAITSIYPVADWGIMRGYPDGTFAPGKVLTRAEAVVVLSRLRDEIRERYPDNVDPLTKNAILATVRQFYRGVAEAGVTNFDQLVNLVEAKRLPATRAFLDEHFSYLNMKETDFASPPRFDELMYVSRVGADTYRLTVQYYSGELAGSQARTYYLKTQDGTSWMLIGTQEAAGNPEEAVRQPTGAGNTRTEPEAVPPRLWVGAHVFDPMSVRPGDQVAGMTVDSLHVTPGSPDLPAPLVRITFTGQATVSGTFRHLPRDDASFGGEVAFFVDAESVGRLPRLYYDERDVWFRFANAEEAKRSFGNPPEGAAGTATIVIDRYEIVYKPTEAVNTAVLANVVTTSNQGEQKNGTARDGSKD